MNLKQKRLKLDTPLYHIKTLAKTIPNYRFVVYGEYVRDSILKLNPMKIDVFTSASVDLIINILSRKIIPHKHLLVSRNSVTTTTTDGVGIVIEHSPLKLMKKKANANGIFTVNTILYDLKSNNFFSSTRSLNDLHNQVIKTANNPEDAFKFKPTTMIDACGLLALNTRMQLGEQTREEIDKRYAVFHTQNRTQKLLTKMSLLKIMEYQIPSRAFRRLHEIGILKIILPELDATVGVVQNRHHNIHFCPDCKNFFTLNRSNYQRWDTATVKDDAYTKKVLNKYRKG